MLYINLKEDINKCLNDPVYNIIQNFSLERSEEFYDKWVVQWACGDYKSNPAVKREEERVEFTSLADLPTASAEAHNLCINLKSKEFNKDVEWHIYGNFIAVTRYRLKTFDEWLHDGLYEALCQAYKSPEDGARKILEKKLGEGVYTNTMIHCFAEGKINVETLKRLGQYEKYQPMEGRDIEKDIEQAMTSLYDIKENNVTVLKLKI